MIIKIYNLFSKLNKKLIKELKSFDKKLDLYLLENDNTVYYWMQDIDFKNGGVDIVSNKQGESCYFSGTLKEHYYHFILK